MGNSPQFGDIHRDTESRRLGEIQGRTTHTDVVLGDELLTPATALVVGEADGPPADGAAGRPVEGRTAPEVVGPETRLVPFELAGTDLGVVVGALVDLLLVLLAVLVGHGDSHHANQGHGKDDGQLHTWREVDEWGRDDI